jgi:hypothetical protein
MPLEEDGNRNILSSLRDLHCARSIASISRYDLLSKTCECQQGPQGTDLYSRLVRYPIQPFEHGCEYCELVTSDYRRSLASIRRPGLQNGSTPKCLEYCRLAFHMTMSWTCQHFGN